jgi:hypothetical protein
MRELGHNLRPAFLAGYLGEREDAILGQRAKVDPTRVASAIPDEPWWALCLGYAALRYSGGRLD